MKKKILTLILALALVMSLFTLTACGDSDDAEDEEDDTSTSQSSSKDEDEDEEDNSAGYSLSQVEIATFNDPIIQYEGSSILGSSVSSLISDLVTNAATNEGVEEKLPTVILYDSDGEETIADGTDDYDDYTDDLKTIRISLSSRHNYEVEVTSYNSDGYVEEITITY